MVSGFITKLHVDEGSIVRKGQVLFTIDQVQYRAAVETAKASVATAKAALQAGSNDVDLNGNAVLLVLPAAVVRAVVGNFYCIFHKYSMFTKI